MKWIDGPYKDSAEAHTDIGVYKVMRVLDTFRVIVNGSVICRDEITIHAAKESAKRHFDARPQ